MMRKVQLKEIAYARSGDKGDIANVGLIAKEPRYYPILLEKVTAQAVKQFFGQIVKGKVVRSEMPKLHAMNFALYNSLGGGATRTLNIDQTGKTMGTALLRMEIEIPE